MYSVEGTINSEEDAADMLDVDEEEGGGMRMVGLIGWSGVL